MVQTMKNIQRRVGRSVTGEKLDLARVIQDEILPTTSGRDYKIKQITDLVFYRKYISES
jgi:hypothetical protein